MKQIRLRSVLVASAFLLLGACHSTSASSTNSAAAMNAKCPVSGEQLDANCPTMTFEGKTVGFCCNKCVQKFNTMTPADKQAKVTGAMPAK